MGRIRINTKHFTQQEIRVVESTLKEWDYDWIVEIDYVKYDNEDKIDATFLLDEEDLGELLHVLYGCGYNGAFGKLD